ncbi:MAG: nucleoside monophosphate kinase [Clostridia bacterium]
MIIVLLGAPGSGKGTISRLISENKGIPCISTGEMLRKTEDLPKEAIELLQKGELLPDSVINNLLLNRISKDDCKAGFILDGYPRNYEQAVCLDQLLGSINRKVTAAFLLEVSKETIYRRILSRKECVNCRATFSLDTPEKVENICDKCGSEIKVRADDNKEALDRRLAIFNTNTDPIVEYYKKKGVLKSIDSGKTPEIALEQALAE